MRTPIFHGRIHADGRFGLLESERVQRQSYFRTLAGQDVEVIVRKARTKRSLDQNAYLHAEPFPLLAEHFGDSVTGIKLSLMGEFWGWQKDKRTGRDVPVKPHTSEMTVDECARFIDWLIPWAATEHGVSILLPDEWNARQAA